MPEVNCTFPQSGTRGGHGSGNLEFHAEKVIFTGSGGMKISVSSANIEYHTNTSRKLQKKGMCISVKDISRKWILGQQNAYSLQILQKSRQVYMLMYKILSKLHLTTCIILVMEKAHDTCGIIADISFGTILFKL